MMHGELAFRSPWRIDFIRGDSRPDEKEGRSEFPASPLFGQMYSEKAL